MTPEQAPSPERARPARRREGAIADHTIAPKPLPAALRARINRAAHAAGLRYAATTLATMLAQLERTRDAGATFDQLATLVDRLESGHI
jgi:hypothetical protein